MATEATDLRRYDLIRERQLTATLAEEYPESSVGGKFYADLMRSMARSATDYAKSVHMEAGAGVDDDWDWSEFHELLQASFDIVRNVMFSLNAWGDRTEPKPWRHHKLALEDIMRGEIPDMGRQQIENIVSDYLALPYRNARMDRLLVDLLVALELFAFGKESRIEIKRHSLWGWLKLRVYSAALWLLTIWLGWKMVEWRWISDGTGTTIQLICIIWFVAGTVLSLALLFRTNPRAKMLLEMAKVYTELDSDGPISAQHIEECAKAASETGVAWPPPLYVLLEDLRMRAGRF